MAIAEKETRDGRDRAKRSKERASERADERKREMRERSRYHSDVIAISWFDVFSIKISKYITESFRVRERIENLQKRCQVPTRVESQLLLLLSHVSIDPCKL